MNRRNFMKTFALAVGVSPLALAAKPEVPFKRLSKDEAVDRWYYIQGNQFTPCEPPVNRRVNAILKHDDFYEGFGRTDLFFKGVPIVSMKTMQATVSESEE